MSRTGGWTVALLMLVVGFGIGVLWPVAPRPATPEDGSSPAFTSKPVSHVEHDKALMALIESSRSKSGSAVYNLGIANYYWALWRDHSNRSPQPSVLEIGPGENLGQGVLLVAMGARKYTGLDLYRPPQLLDRHSYQAA